MSKNRREVTERDFRAPEFREADPADYEFRDDGAIVRKDRWERGIRSIRAIIDPGRGEFEIHELVATVERIVGRWCQADPEDFPGPDVQRIDVKLACGSVLVGLWRSAEGERYDWGFRKCLVDASWFGSDVIEWRETLSDEAAP
jgi:hypothetical protein